MFKHACIHKPAIPTFVADLSRYTLRSILPEKWGWQAASGAKTIPLVKTYDLTIVTGAADNVTLAASPFIQPTSVTLHLLSTAPWRSFSRLIESLSDIKRLDIICKTQYHPPSLRLPEAQPQLTHLELHLKKFTSIDIAEYLVPNLIELHIVQSQTDIMSPPPIGLSLPKLKVLGVTPPNTGFACLLDLPMLEKVVLYGVQKSSPAVVMTLVHFANGIDLGRVRNLELRNWSYSQRYWGTFGQGAVGLITEVPDQMWSIVNLDCVESAIDGDSLVRLVMSITEASTTTALETVIIDCCSGITRADCDAIWRLVTKMEIYI
ncbi:hypothetical protein M408DRAFT_324235 [Serendipita vermifera MAFF 305830]|uniref:F-box domain-containing protein n=1 Tax=Serendipita vermifera MAFF 305830 TaxID=933852 RepID=A0A0C3AS26_SERVB|nr:hypothetical protein M408DRAFT_324235 [Serendipita vermifera MAFF 305830]